MCRECKARGDAHFGWCTKVGGSGVKPGSVQAATLAAQAVALTPSPLPASWPAVRSWGPPRPYSHPGPGDADYVDPCPGPLPVDQLQSATPVRTRAHSARPGAELSKDVRQLVLLAIERGWEYLPGAAAADGQGHARLVRDGQEVRLPSKSAAVNLQVIRSGLRRVGALA